MPTLTLEEQVGQLIVAIWPGDSEELAGLVAHGQVGGILLGAGAAPDEGALVEALGRLQRLATYPLLCIGDAEGGLGPFVPGALALAAARRPELARRAGAQAAAEARARGLQLVLAPPFDVWREPGAQPSAGPSFGDNPSRVARLAAAYVAGCQQGGAMAVGRYFPGRGGATYDAASRLMVVRDDRATLDKIDLLPYAEACAAGLGAVMTGHLHVAALDNLPNRLATHSSAVAEGLLRRSLQFGGLLFTDDLDAPEVKVRYQPAEAAVLAFAAGHDLLVTASPARVYEALYEVLLHGDIPATRLQEALGRIWAARAQLGAGLAQRIARPDAPACAAGKGDELAQGPELAREVAQAALTLVRGRPELLARPRLLVVTQRGVRSDGSRLEEDVQRLAAGRLGEPAIQVLDPRPASAQIDAVLAAAASASAALLLLDLSPGEHDRGHTAEPIIALAQALKSAGLPVGVALIGNPYLLPRFAQVDLLLYVASDGPAYLDAVFAYLYGEIEAPGRLPVLMHS